MVLHETLAEESAMMIASIGVGKLARVSVLIGLLLGVHARVAFAQG